MRIGARLTGVERTLARQVSQTGDPTLSRVLQSLQSNRSTGQRSVGVSDRFESSRLESQLTRLSNKIDRTTQASARLGEFRSTISAVRDQVAIIKSAAGTDLNGELSASQRAAAQSSIDSALSEIARLTGGKIAKRSLLGAADDHDSQNTISGIDVAQVSGVTVNRIRPNRSETISGEVTQAAERAVLQLEGRNDGTVHSTANFTLTGTDGSHTFQITEGESLAAVRDRINAESESTGVEAVVDGTDLRFQTVRTGAAETIDIVLNNLEDFIEVTGLNQAQVATFTPANLVEGADVQLDGEFFETSAAVLEHSGAAGKIKFDATFELTGNNGTATISVSKLESLTDARDRINLESANTGVTATVDGDRLIFTSDQIGVGAITQVNVLSGKFKVDGGDGNGNATGDDRHAIIEDVRVNESGGTFTYNDPEGDFTFEFAEGFTGEFDRIRVKRLDGEFNITGGDGFGSDNGVDGEAIINGQTVTSATNSFTFSSFRFGATVDFTEGFSGDFDTITVDNSFDFVTTERTLGFAVPGVDGQRFASLRLQGIDAAALGGSDGTLAMLATGEALGDLNDAAQAAYDVADAALTQLDGLLSKIDSFQSDTLDAAATELDTEKTSLNASISLLKDKIAAAEQAEASRQKLLESSLEAGKNSALTSLLTSLSTRRNKVLSMLTPG